MLLGFLNRAINKANLVLHQEAHLEATLPIVKIRTREKRGDEDQGRTLVQVNIERTIGVLHLFKSESVRLNFVCHGGGRGEA